MKQRQKDDRRESEEGKNKTLVVRACAPALGLRLAEASDGVRGVFGCRSLWDCWAGRRLGFRSGVGSNGRGWLRHPSGSNGASSRRGIERRRGWGCRRNRTHVRAPGNVAVRTSNVGRRSSAVGVQTAASCARRRDGRSGQVVWWRSCRVADRLVTHRVGLRGRRQSMGPWVGGERGRSDVGRSRWRLVPV